MTVAELVAKLQEMPQDAKVIFYRGGQEDEFWQEVYVDRLREEPPCVVLE